MSDQSGEWYRNEVRTERTPECTLLRRLFKAATALEQAELDGEIDFDRIQELREKLSAARAACYNHNLLKGGDDARL